MTEDIAREFTRLEARQLTYVLLICGLIMAQIIAKIVIFGWIIALLRRTEKLHAATVQLLNLVEDHAKETDKRGDRVVEVVKDVRNAATTAASRAAELSTKVEAIPEKIAEKIARNGHDSGQFPASPPADADPEDAIGGGR